MDVKELIKKVRKIEFKAQKHSMELFSGNYSSAFKGKGMSFSQVRPYYYGDDVRNIDWNVTSRYNEPFIKEFDEEREMSFCMLLDMSNSNAFGTKVVKKDILVEIAATLAFSTQKNNDKLSLVLFTDQIEQAFPAGKGRGHVLRLIREMLDTRPKSHKTDIQIALKHLLATLKRKTVIFILSDFLAEPNYYKELNMLAKRHKVYGIQIYDKLEANFEDLGLLQIQDLESQETQWIDSTTMDSTYFRDNQEAHHQLFKKSGASMVSLSTEEDYVLPLHQMFYAH
ncbi:MAG: DUF58 domain-containing protein [Chitinophagales bacterium]|jgi:uncharacterized protein (DUF58 family)|nr:DUF58 domain-containing protein [Chitinophagales bacterium]